MNNFVITVDNAGNTTAHYVLKSGTRVSHLIVPVKELVRQYLELQMFEIKYIIERFDYETPETYINDPDMIEILNNLPYSNIIPGQDLQTEEQITNFNHTQLLNSYNKIHNTNFTLEELNG